MLTIVLLDVRRLEVLRVLDVVESPAQGLEAVRIVCKLCSSSCVDDILCIDDGIGYLFPVVPTVVVAMRLRPSGLDYWWLATPAAVAARNFLISLVLLLMLLLALVASGGTACLRHDRCSSP